MKWLVADSLYCPEQFFCSHLSSYSHYLAEAGEEVQVLELPSQRLDYDFGGDVVFALDRYDRMAFEPTRNPVKRIAQVAAITNPLPWDVRKTDGSPAYDLVISSIPWMVEEARAKGCRAEYMPLAFDTRALVCSMGVKERDIPCLFVGTRTSNHRKREEVLAALGDLVTIAPPTFGREYFKLLARARVVISPHAEWARGAKNNMRLFEGVGLGCVVLTDGTDPKDECLPGFDLDGTEDERELDRKYGRPDAERWRRNARYAVNGGYEYSDAYETGAFDRQKLFLFEEHTYVQRIPRLIEFARSL